VVSKVLLEVLDKHFNARFLSKKRWKKQKRTQKR